MVLLHGLYSNPWQIIHYQGITQEAEKRGYLVVAPFGYNATGWYGSRGPGKDFGLGLKQPPNAPEMLMVAYAVDVYRQWQGPDYGFWLSFFGLLAFWGGLSLLHAGNERGALLYAFINVLLIFVGVVLDRRAFVVFGALGFNGYLGHLAWEVFAQSALFPFVLSAFGLFVIACGVLYARQGAAWRAALVDHLPPASLRLVPGVARSQQQSSAA